MPHPFFILPHLQKCIFSELFMNCQTMDFLL